MKILKTKKAKSDWLNAIEPSSINLNPMDANTLFDLSGRIVTDETETLDFFACLKEDLIFLDIFQKQCDLDDAYAATLVYVSFEEFQDFLKRHIRLENWHKKISKYWEGKEVCTIEFLLWLKDLNNKR